MASRAVAVRTRTRTVTRRTRARRSAGTGKGFSLAIIAGLAPGVMDAWNWYKVTNGTEGLKHLMANYIPYDPWSNKVSFYYAKTGLVPLVAGLLVHYVADRTGVNRMIRNAIKIPVGI